MRKFHGNIELKRLAAYYLLPPPIPFLSLSYNLHGKMSEILTIALLLCFLKEGVYMATAWEDEDFFKYCPIHRCSKHGPEIRFPFRLESSNTSSLCAASHLNLACVGQDIILVNPTYARYKVTDIDYRQGALALVPRVDGSSLSCKQKLMSAALPRSTDYEDPFPPLLCGFGYAVIVSCLRKFTPSNRAGNYIIGPISCLSNTTYFSYLVDGDADQYMLPLDCKAGDSFFPMPIYTSTFKEIAERILSFSETTTAYYCCCNRNTSDTLYNCIECERDGRRCGFSPQKNQTFCINHGSHIKVIAATSSTAALVVLLLMVATALYLSLKTRYNDEVHLKGGFGSVYKGELPNGVPVAVKMLENSTGEGEEFINEVASIGLIHHANIVRLLGFCSEGTRRALIYEFMPNESLEKYIFLSYSNTSPELTVPNKMVDVALGIARGMEYLHQGCNKRILHFDIKPHNILLDYNFNPKISDFGLAKLCARDQSIVTLTAARGTMGYIAPELYSQMVSGRRNSDPSVDSQNEVYLPEWIFEKIITGQDLVTRDMTGEQKEKVRQLAIVALWCIQWNPRNRPSMTKVVNMLTGRLENLQMPPKPFVSSESQEMP
ncbi:unnamed protein product [Urochloa decumbens]|uniref:non-specific serine/threonine protein kinase n=1 Tax=Urochloa decumbens TaxID=240449 RepID=A0ABC9A9U3_9POAL